MIVKREKFLFSLCLLFGAIYSVIIVNGDPNLKDVVSSVLEDVPSVDVLDDVSSVDLFAGASAESSSSEYIMDSGRLYDILRRGKDLIKMLPHMGIVIAGRILDTIPTPSEILNFGKQTLVGLPQEVVAYAIDSVCSSAVHLNAIKPSFVPDINEMNFMLITRDNLNITVPLKEPHTLWHHSHFQVNSKIVLLVTGWNSNINLTNDAVKVLYEAFRCRDDYNFVVIDTAQFVNSLYMWSAFSTAKIGTIIGHALVELVKFVPLQNIHLIGHSLGAHICANAGRTFTRLTNLTLPRITGLDPARPCFKEGERLSGLHRGDAAFIDVIHTNPGILGIKESIGDVDFYPNGRDPLQPGCWSIICAHGRSYEYFAESVYRENENNFLSTRCNSIHALRHGKCGGKQIPMGIATPTTSKGNHFLITNRKAPYGKSRSWNFWSKSKQTCDNSKVKFMTYYYAENIASL